MFNIYINGSITRNMLQVKCISSLMLVLLPALTVYFADATYIMVNGGYCMTYESTEPDTLIKFEPCNFEDDRHNSWKFITIESGASLVCIGETQICDHVASDNKKYLTKKDPTDLSQQWTTKSGNRFTNGLTGPNKCAQAIDPDGNGIPNHIEMKTCSDNRKQKFVTFSSSSQLARYLRYYQSSEQEYESFHNSFPHQLLYHPYYFHPIPTIPYYYL